MTAMVTEEGIGNAKWCNETKAPNGESNEDVFGYGPADHCTRRRCCVFKEMLYTHSLQMPSVSTPWASVPMGTVKTRLEATSGW